MTATSTVYLAKLWGSVSLALTIAIPIAIIGMVFFLLMWKKQHNTDVDIEVKTGGGSRIDRDMAKVVTENGIKKLVLFWRNIKLPYNPKVIYQMKGNKQKAYYSQVGAEDYVPCARDVEGKFVTLAQNTKAWACLEMRENRERNSKQTTWDKYGNQIIMIGTIVVCMFMLIYSAKMNIDAIKSTPSPANIDAQKINNDVNRLEQIAEKMGMQTAPTKPINDQSQPP